MAPTHDSPARDPAVRDPAVRDPAALARDANTLRALIVDLTLRICRERTVNYFEEDYPNGGPDGMESPGQEGKVARILAGLFDQWGVPYTLHEKVPGRTNLLARVGSGEKGHRKLMALLHEDTVPAGSPGDWSFPPFEPFEKDGKLYGRGVLDNKGPLAACVATVKMLKDREADIPGTFIFGAVADEEVDIGAGIDHLIEQGLVDATDAVIPDIAGEMLEINVAEKGQVILKVRAHGKQAHAMEPSKGVSAIHGMARFLQALEGMPLTHESHRLLGGPTINTGLIHGGVATNAVAADCEATLDVRYVPGQSPQGIRAEVEALARSIGFPGCVFDVSVFKSSLPCEVPADAPIVRRILRYAPHARVMGSGGGTFAKPLVLAGLQAVGWAPGNEETYHQPNEEIEVDQLVTYAGRLAGLALELCAERVGE